MALDYDGSPNGIMLPIGKNIKHINEYETLGKTTTAASGTLEADEDEIIDVLEASSSGTRRDQVAQTRSLYRSLRSQVDQGFRNPLATEITRRYQDHDTVIVLLNLSTTDIQTILKSVHQDMVDAPETLNRSASTLGAVSAVTGTGNGTVLHSKVLDGVTAPGFGMLPNLNYRDLNSELCMPSETITVRCVQDFKSGASEGMEVFEVRGERSFGPFSTITPNGSQGLATVRGHHFHSIISNGVMEVFGTANIPSGWTLGSGMTAGTHIVEESATADVYRGDKAIKFDNTASAQATLEITQAPVLPQLIPHKRYRLTLRYKATATIAAGDFQVMFKSASGAYVASSSEKIDIIPGSLATTWTLVNFEITMPATIPDDLLLHVSWTGTPTASKFLWVDDLAFGPVTYYGGFNLIPITGSTPWVNGDYLTFTSANDQAGVIQDMHRRIYGIQLPSSGTPSILDSLAT